MPSDRSIENDSKVEPAVKPDVGLGRRTSSRPPSEPPGRKAAFRTLQRRTIAFSIVCGFATVAVTALIQPAGWTAETTQARTLLNLVQTNGHGLDLTHVPALVVVGLAAGFLAGLLGMGGGVLKVSGMLVVFQMDMLLARAISLTTMFVATGVAAYVHHRDGKVLPQVVKPILPASLVGVVLGLVLGNMVPTVTLKHFFAFFVLFLGYNTLAQILGDPREATFRKRFPKELPPRRRGVARVIGLVHGGVCGLLGISGGVIATPMQQMILRVPARNAIANTVVISVYCTGVGSLVSVASGVTAGNFSLGAVLLGTLCIGGGAAVGAAVGARISSKAPILLLKGCFMAICFVAGLTILLK